MTRSNQREQRGQRGAVAVIAAILLLVLGGFLALSLNIGHLMSVRGELQNASDSGALAGAWDLDGTLDGTTKARASALDYATRHATDATSLVAGDITVELGYWSHDHGTFDVITGTSPSELRATNAVRVRSTRAGTNPADVFMPVFLGDRKTADVGTDAIAVRGGPCTEGCGLPLAFAACHVLDADGNVKCQGQKFLFQSDPEDNIGFTSLGTGPVNPPVVQAILNGIIAGSCGAPVKVGDPINIQNGADIQPATAEFAALPKGTYFVPVVDIPCTGTSGKFIQSGRVVGFASVEILYAGDLKHCPPELVPPELVGATGNPKMMVLQLHCGEPSHYTAGCDLYGPLPDPTLVR